MVQGSPHHQSPLSEQGMRRTKYCLRRSALLKIDAQTLLANYQMLQLGNMTLLPFKIFFKWVVKIAGILLKPSTLPEGAWQQAVKLGAIQISRDRPRGRGGVLQMIADDHARGGGGSPNDHR